MKHRHGWLPTRIIACIKGQMRKTDLKAHIRVFKNGKEYLLGPASNLLMLRLQALNAKEDDELVVLAGGPDAEEALEVFETRAHECALTWPSRFPVTFQVRSRGDTLVRLTCTLSRGIP